jgi:hypothetical protein
MVNKSQKWVQLQIQALRTSLITARVYSCFYNKPPLEGNPNWKEALISETLTLWNPNVHLRSNKQLVSRWEDRSFYPKGRVGNLTSAGLFLFLITALRWKER